MLYIGSGKTHMVEAIANELNALLIHITPSKLRGNFGGKSGPTKLVHLVMSVARDPTMQPCIIYIDECEQFFTGGKKASKKSSDKSDNMSRFKKDLNTYRNQVITSEHRILFIGTSNKPESFDIKDCKSFFDKFLYFPPPNYTSRLLIWEKYLNECTRDYLKKYLLTLGDSYDTSMITQRITSLLVNIDTSALAYISSGYTGGSILRTIKSVITYRRIMLLVSQINDISINKTYQLFTSKDFVGDLSLQEQILHDVGKVFIDFTKVITGINDRRKKIIELLSSSQEDEKNKKDSKKGSKKK